MEDIIAYLSQLEMVYLYIAVFLVAYIENIFPPAPSDVTIVVAGSLVAIGEGNIILTILLATFGSTLGFMTMYWLGDQFGARVLEKGKISFISAELVSRVQNWFKHYGYWVVAANRFLSGTRGVISFCAGIAEMSLFWTTVLSAVSALIWNAILVYLGVLVGDNWQLIDRYLSTYSKVITIVVVLLIVIWASLAILKKNGKNNKKNV